MIYAKPYAVAFFVVAAVAIGMLGAEKLRAQPVAPSPVDCDRYAQDYARNHSRNGQVLRGAGGGALLGAGIGALHMVLTVKVRVTPATRLNSVPMSAFGGTPSRGVPGRQTNRRTLGTGFG